MWTRRLREAGQSVSGCDLEYGTRKRNQNKTHVDGGLQAALHARALERGVHVAHGLAGGGLGPGHQGRDLAGELELRLDGVGPLHGYHDACVGEAAVDGPADAVGVDVGDDDVLGAQDLADGAAEQADGAGAEDEHGGARVEAGAVAGVQGDGEGLGEGAQLEGHAVGQPVAVGGRVGDLLLEGALGVGEALCRGAEGHGAADVVAALGAQLALAAGEADLEGDVVAGLEPRHARAHGRHGAGGLVAQGHGLAHLDVAVAVVAVVVQVGAAEARRLDGHQDFGGLEGRDGALFLCCLLGGAASSPSPSTGGGATTYHAEILCCVEHRGPDCLCGHLVAVTAGCCGKVMWCCCCCCCHLTRCYGGKSKKQEARGKARFTMARWEVSRW